MITAEYRCIICGCTDASGCAGGCEWVGDAMAEYDLCTRCAGPFLDACFAAIDNPKKHSPTAKAMKYIIREARRIRAKAD